MITIETLRQRQSLPLEAKILMTERRVKEFFDKLEGKVYLSFSGGKDSQVLGELIRRMPKPYCDIEFVFFDTHNERGEVRDIVKKYGATIIPSPKMPKEVIEKVGYPLINKRTAHIINCFQKGYNLNLDVRNKEARDTPYYVWENYKWLIFAPIKISDLCCDELKKKPSKQFFKDTGKSPIIATMTVDSQNRLRSYLSKGCNAFGEGNELSKSTPMAFWKKQDVLDYIGRNNIEIASCYEQEFVKSLCNDMRTCKLNGVKQTGCMFCGFGKGVDFALRILKAKCPEYYDWLMGKKEKYGELKDIPEADYKVWNCLK